MHRTDLARAIYRISHLTGQFKLRSGQISREYFDKYQFESQPVLLAAIAEHLAAFLPAKTEVIAGLEMGGIPLATALSLYTGIPAAFVRKQPKPYGTQRIAEGAAVTGKNVVVLEDVVTTGGQVVESVSALREAGASVEEVLCVINRGGAVAIEHLEKVHLRLRALFTTAELEKFAVS